MKASTLKTLTGLFWTAVAGLVVCLGGTIYTAVTAKSTGPQVQTSAQSIPVPAEAPK